MPEIVLSQKVYDELIAVAKDGLAFVIAKGSFVDGVSPGLMVRLSEAIKNAEEDATDGGEYVRENSSDYEGREPLRLE